MTRYDLSRHRWYRPTLAELDAEAWNSPLLLGVVLYEFRPATVHDVLGDAVAKATRAPRALSEPRALSAGLDGYLVPLRDRQPVWLRLPGVEAPALPIFSTLAALRRALLGVPGFSYVEVDTIVNGREFLAGLPRDGSIELVVDPFVTDEQTTRYRRILL